MTRFEVMPSGDGRCRDVEVLRASMSRMEKRTDMRGSVTRRDEGERLVLGSAVNRIVFGGADTDGSSSVLETVLEANWDGVPLHYHVRVDHVFVVLSGAVHITIGETRYVLTSGDVAWVPRGEGHELGTGEQPCSLLRLDTPQPLDGLVRDLTAVYAHGSTLDPAVADTIMARHDTHRIID